MKRLTLLLIALFTAVAWAEPTGTSAGSGLVAHEWGTFTTVSGGSGAALEWRPLSGPDDLPRFVHTNGRKLGWRGRVRMETPVIYFYTDRERTVRAKVHFTEGVVTEWYPWANRGEHNGVNWGGFRLIPPTSPAAKTFKLPHEGSPSHYYPARKVDAAFVRSCRDASAEGFGGCEVDRFLFYRGVGNVSLPLQVKCFGHELLLRNTGKHPIPRMLVFEREGEQVRYAALGQLRAGHSRNVRPGRLNAGSQKRVEQALREDLLSTGLYPKEADAMLATWRDHWFEEGVRVFYLVPRADTDRVLPLTLEPQPEELVRTLVARVEVITERYSARLLELAQRFEATQDRSLARELHRQGRFAEPALEQLVAEGKLSKQTLKAFTR